MDSVSHNGSKILWRRVANATKNCHDPRLWVEKIIEFSSQRQMTRFLQRMREISTPLPIGNVYRRGITISIGPVCSPDPNTIVYTWGKYAQSGQI